MLVRAEGEAGDWEPKDAFGNASDRNDWTHEDNDVIVWRVGILFVACDAQLLVTSALDYELAFD